MPKVRRFGRRHQIAFGVSIGWAHQTEAEGDIDAPIDYGDIRQLKSLVIPLPSYGAIEQQGRIHDHLTRVYGAAHLDFADRLKGVVGLAAIWLDTTGQSYGTDATRSNSAVSPYAGLLFDLTVTSRSTAATIRSWRSTLPIGGSTPPRAATSRRA